MWQIMGAKFMQPGMLGQRFFKENSIWQKKMVTSLNNSNNNFIRVLSKSKILRYFPPFFNKIVFTHTN